jgi:ethanolamine utilization protein EutN
VQLARVIGKVVATVKDEKYRGLKLLVLEPLDERAEVCGSPFIAAEAGLIRAGYGEIVYWEGSREAPLAMPDPHTAVDAAVVGIVDRLDLAR